MTGEGPSENIEYERRWLVSDPSVLDGLKGDVVSQAYVFAEDGYAIRVRRREAETGDRASGSLTLKGPRSQAARLEYELELPSVLAGEFIRRCDARILKIRYSLVDGGYLWDIDRFLGANEGLLLAECESASPVRMVNVPAWCGREVTDDRRYDNDVLAFRPFTTW